MNCAYTNKLSQIIATVSSIAQESFDGDFVFNDRASSSTTSMHQKQIVGINPTCKSMTTILNMPLSVGGKLEWK